MAGPEADPSYAVTDPTTTDLVDAYAVEDYAHWERAECLATEPGLFGARLGVRPHPRITLGISRAAIFGGEGRPLTLRKLAGLAVGVIRNSDFENQILSFDARLRLPMVLEWGFWEGRDSARQPLEMDIACTLLDGRVMTGGIKWNTRPLTLRWHVHHLNMLDRLAASGVKWAHQAREASSPLIWIAAGGFTKEFCSNIPTSGWS